MDQVQTYKGFKAQRAFHCLRRFLQLADHLGGIGLGGSTFCCDKGFQKLLQFLKCKIAIFCFEFLFFLFLFLFLFFFLLFLQKFSSPAENKERMVTSLPQSHQQLENGCIVKKHIAPRAKIIKFCFGFQENCLVEVSLRWREIKILNLRRIRRLERAKKEKRKKRKEREREREREREEPSQFLVGVEQ